MHGTPYPRTRDEFLGSAKSLVETNSRTDVDAEILTSLRSRVLNEATAYLAARTTLTAAEGVVERREDERNEANDAADADMAALFAMVKRQGGKEAQQTLRSLWGGEALHELLDLDDEVQTRRIDDFLSRVDGAAIRLPPERADAVRVSNAALAVAASNLSKAERAVEVASTNFLQCEAAFKEKYRRFVRIISSTYGEAVALDLFPIYPQRRRQSRASDAEPPASSPEPSTDAPVAVGAADPQNGAPGTASE